MGKPSGLQGLVFGVDLVDCKAYSEKINQGNLILWSIPVLGRPRETYLRLQI